MIRKLLEWFERWLTGRLAWVRWKLGKHVNPRAAHWEKVAQGNAAEARETLYSLRRANEQISKVSEQLSRQEITNQRLIAKLAQTEAKKLPTPIVVEQKAPDNKDVQTFARKTLEETKEYLGWAKSQATRGASNWKAKAGYLEVVADDLVTALGKIATGDVGGGADE